MKKINKRQADYDIEDIFLKRWSPRAMSGKTVTKKELMTLFEAARWAPSSMNNQLWRFIYCTRTSKKWDIFLSLLHEYNRVWCHNAAALVLVASKKTFDFNGSFSPTHQFDTGSAWENLALQATKMDLVTHGVGGFDRDKARTELHVPEELDVIMMIVIGKPGKKEDLPAKLQERETPSTRRPLSEIVFEEKYK